MVTLYFACIYSYDHLFDNVVFVSLILDTWGSINSLLSIELNQTFWTSFYKLNLVIQRASENEMKFSSSQTCCKTLESSIHLVKSRWMDSPTTVILWSNCGQVVVKWSTRMRLLNRACSVIHHQLCHPRCPISDRLPERASPRSWSDPKSHGFRCNWWKWLRYNVLNIQGREGVGEFLCPCSVKYQDRSIISLH